MRRFAFLALVLLPTLAAAQGLRRAGDWIPYPDAKGCVGGSGCSERRLRVPLEDRPVVGVRFRAHDQVGTKAEGVLRLKLDGTTVDSYIDIPRSGQLFTIDVDEMRGRYLVFEPVTDDEVEISEVAVLYTRDTLRRLPRQGGRGTGGWLAYPRATGCIGGSTCGRNGTRITIALEDLPVLGVRFLAHDNVGQRAAGKVSVRIDSTSVAWREDVKREGRRHEYDVESLTGSRLVIEAASDDEIEVKDVQVLYGRARAEDRWSAREATHEGGCIGGSQCGGRRSRIRIPIYGRPVDSIRFYARDDIGTRAGGELRISIDDQVVQNYLDIPREGKTFTLDGRGLSGDYLIIEPAEDDEVEIKDVRVRFGEGED